MVLHLSGSGAVGCLLARYRGTHFLQFRTGRLQRLETDILGRSTGESDFPFRGLVVSADRFKRCVRLKISIARSAGLHGFQHCYPWYLQPVGREAETPGTMVMLQAHMP
jgi:hypothetical protein